MAFQAHSEDRGVEWWRWSEDSGLQALDELCAGPCSAVSFNAIEWRDAIYFSVFLPDGPPDRGREVLYELSQGGVFREVFEICEGAGCNLGPQLFPVGDVLYAGRGGGDPLFVSDGTPGGSRAVLDLPWDLIDVFGLSNGELVLHFRPDGSRTDLYRFDGQRLLGRLPLPTDIVVSAASTGDRLVILQNFPDSRLWGSDGTESGTRLLVDNPPTGFSAGMTGADGQVFFSLSSLSPALWRSDGTPAGTYEVSPGRAVGRSLSPRALLGAEERLLFSVDRRDSNFSDVLSSDGTGAGSITLFERTNVGARWTVDMGGEALAFLRLSREGEGSEPWLSDGTAEGSRPVGPADGTFLQWLREPVVAGDSLFYLADAGAGQKLWRTDGSRFSTQLVADLEPSWRNVHVGCVGVGCGPPQLPTPIFPRELVALAGGTLAMVGGGAESGAEVWLSDGTDSGTRLLVDLRPGPEGSAPEQLSAVDDSLFFTADPGVGRGLYRWPGSGAPARLGSVGQPVMSAVVGSSFVWLEDDGETIRAGRSDGSVDGTGIFASWRGVLGAERAVLGDSLYVISADAEKGAELWAISPSLGTASPVVDLWPGPKGSYPLELLVADGALHWSAADPVFGRELWRLDPGSTSPERLFDLAPGAASSSPSMLTAAGSRLYFVADAGETGREVWGLDLAQGRCRAAEDRRCLGEGRFAVTVRWRIPATGEEGVGRVLPGTDDSAYFWFFSPGN
ncbi:MAG: hypothetical protein AAFY88_11160, partial [Acidobacteriota bacterium]